MTRGRASLWVLPAFAAAGVVFTWPLATVFGSAVPAVFNAIDPLLQAFIVGWDLDRLGHGLAGWWNAPIFHPEPRALTYMDHLLGESLFAAPVAALAGLAAGYNTVVVLSFAFSGWAFYRLVRALGASRAAAFVCGFLYAVSPYRLSNLGNLNQLQTQLLPLGIWFGLRFAARGRGRDLAATAATLVVQTYFGWYYAFHLAFALVVVLAWMRREGAPGVTPLPWLRLALATAAALVAIAPGAWPYWFQHSSMAGFRRSLGKAVLYSADLMDYVKLNRENALAGALGLPTGDLAYALGFVATVLALVGVVMVVRGRVTGSLAALQPAAIARGFCALGLASFVLSLGPILQVAGHRLPVPLPYAALYFLIPGFTAMRAPGRFAGLVLIVGLVFAAWGFDAIRQRITSRLGRALLFATTLALAGVLAWSSPIPLVTLPTADELPAAHRWIAQQPGAFAILELPMPAREADEQERDARRQVWILYHGKRRVDGVSGFSSPAHEAFRRQMQDIPDPEAVAAVIATGARYVVVRYGEYPPDQVERIRSGLSAAREFVPVFESGDDVVYLIVAGELLAHSRVP